MLGLLAVGLAAGEPVGPAPRIMADQPIVVAGPQASATLTVVGGLPASAEWSQVADRINPARTRGTAQIAKGPLPGSVVVTLPEPGVYQFRAVVSVSGEAKPVIAQTWIAAWDARNSLDPGKTLGTGPGVLPPRSVRRLSATPAAFQHPRLLFSDEDWRDMRTRADSGTVAGWGVRGISAWVAGGLDKPDHAHGRLAAALDAWAAAGFAGPAPNIAPFDGGSVFGNEGSKICSVQLMSACYLAWLAHEPGAPAVPAELQTRRARLARIVAGAGQAILNRLWDGPRGTWAEGAAAWMPQIDRPGMGLPNARSLPDLAIAYDIAHDWMDEAQRRPLRDLCFLAGWGRHTQAMDDKGVPKLGSDQNNDFASMNEHNQLLALVIEGEEEAVTPAIRTTLLELAKGGPAEQRLRQADADDPAAWPYATRASVDNLGRQLAWMVEWFLTPWGFNSSHLSYWGFSGRFLLPMTLAYGRRGENPYITAPLYQVNLHALLAAQPGEGVSRNKDLGDTRNVVIDHHDFSGWSQRSAPYILAKYMYPDDPMIDQVWRNHLPQLSRDPFLAALFAVDALPDPPSLERMAADKQLRTTIFCPQRGIVVARNSWRDGDLSLWYDCAGAEPNPAHMHAEKNSFALYGLGRIWSMPPGYHVTVNDAQASVLVRDPARRDDAATEGFFGQAPSSLTQRLPQPGNFPTAPGRLLEVVEGPGRDWTLMAGDASACYRYGLRRPRAVPLIDSRRVLSDFLYPGMLEVLAARDERFRATFGRNLMVDQDNYNSMDHAFRTILVMRGERPYVLVVDDIEKDGKPQDWRWTMNCATGFAPGLDRRFVTAAGGGVYSSLAIQPGATTAEAVLYHSPIDDEKTAGQAGLPRLLVRDLGAQAVAGQPAIVLRSQPPREPAEDYLTYGLDNNHPSPISRPVPTNRVLIDRQGVVQPDYVVLLMPFRTGEAAPQTAWNAKRSELRIDLGDGRIDTIAFDRGQADRRTRLAMTRSGKR